MGWSAKYLGISTALIAAALSVGCQNKLYDQNKELMDEISNAGQNNRTAETQPAAVAASNVKVAAP